MKQHPYDQDPPRPAGPTVLFALSLGQVTISVIRSQYGYLDIKVTATPTTWRAA